MFDRELTKLGFVPHDGAQSLAGDGVPAFWLVYGHALESCTSSVPTTSHIGLCTFNWPAKSDCRNDRRRKMKTWIKITLETWLLILKMTMGKAHRMGFQTGPIKWMGLFPSAQGLVAYNAFPVVIQICTWLNDLQEICKSSIYFSTYPSTDLTL